VKNTVNVLGTNYSITVKAEKDDKFFKSLDCDGYVDKTSKEIVLMQLTDDNCQLKRKEVYSAKTLRHEIIHAFLFESGLGESSGAIESWATNEEMVDWIAYQAPKLFKAFKETGCL